MIPSPSHKLMGVGWGKLLWGAQGGGWGWLIRDSFRGLECGMGCGWECVQNITAGSPIEKQHCWCAWRGGAQHSRAIATVSASLEGFLGTTVGTFSWEERQGSVTVITIAGGQLLGGGRAKTWIHTQGPCNFTGRSEIWLQLQAERGRLAPLVPFWTHASKMNKQRVEFWGMVGAGSAFTGGLCTIHKCGAWVCTDPVAHHRSRCVTAHSLQQVLVPEVGRSTLVALQA